MEELNYSLDERHMVIIVSWFQGCVVEAIFKSGQLLENEMNLVPKRRVTPLLNRSSVHVSQLIGEEVHHSVTVSFVVVTIAAERVDAVLLYEISSQDTFQCSSRVRRDVVVECRIRFDFNISPPDRAEEITKPAAQRCPRINFEHSRTP